MLPEAVSLIDQEIPVCRQRSFLTEKEAVKNDLLAWQKHYQMCAGQFYTSTSC